MQNTNRHRFEQSASLVARVTLEKNGAAFLAGSKATLLEKIHETGSINRAAKAAGMSYKSAWDSVDAMNNLSDHPLVRRQPGGKGGGGTRLTEYGKRLLRSYRRIEAEAQKCLPLLEAPRRTAPEEPWDRYSFQSGARNQFSGKIAELRRGAVNAEVSVQIGHEHRITAICPLSEITSLGLREGGKAFVSFSSAAVILSTDPSVRVSARNCLHGSVLRIEPGAVNVGVSVAIGAGKTIFATIENSGAAALALKTGTRCLAFIKASSVQLGNAPLN